VETTSHCLINVNLNVDEKRYCTFYKKTKSVVVSVVSCVFVLFGTVSEVTHTLWESRDAGGLCD